MVVETNTNTGDGGNADANDGTNTNTGTGQEPEKTLDWYEKELTKTRNEAANYRTKLRDAETKLSAAKTPEEFEAAKAELAAQNKKLERDLLVAKVSKGDPAKKVPALPDELAALLQGDTEAELAAHAEKLRRFVPPVTGTVVTGVNGGLDPSKNADNFDVKEIARKARKGQL